MKKDQCHAGVEQKEKSAGREKTTIYRKLTTIVIDEVSMVRAVLLDCVDRFLRLNGPDAAG